MRVSDAVVGLLGWLVLSALAVLPIAGELYIDLRAWWRTRRNRRVATLINPRCVECARPLDLVEPFTATATQVVRCSGCGVHLYCKRLAELWSICTAAEAKRQGALTLPPVGPLCRAARAVARWLQPLEGVEPGETSLQEPET